MTSKELYGVLDLCLSCHACKAECPSAVDMAKLKAEFLHEYHQKHGTPLRTRLFANIARLNRLGQPVAPLANLLLEGPGKWALSILGVHPARSMPKFAPQTFSQWHRRRKTSAPDRVPRKQVVFFHDTFMEHNHPQVGEAAVRILEAAGFEPLILEDKRCCGRPAVSKGMLAEAKKMARHNVQLLAPYAKAGIPIVGCEPSCMSMLVDEYLDLVPGEESQAVAQMALPLDAFLEHEAQAGRLKPLPFDATPRRILFHGHCQQKASFGTEGTVKFLEMIPNCEVEVVDAGCCGMAGSFGYEKEHYDLSIAIAELGLAPDVRGVAADTIIAATGTSCREQILDTTGREALHPIQIAASALDGA
jgi:Fe-S oxidoreductase